MSCFCSYRLRICNTKWEIFCKDNTCPWVRVKKIFVFFHFFAKKPHFCSYSLVLSLFFTLSTLYFTPIFKISISFFFLIPCLKTPTEHRETTERRAHLLPVKKKFCFLRLRPYKVVLIPKKVDSFPNTVDSIPKTLDLVHLVRILADAIHTSLSISRESHSGISCIWTTNK